MTNINVSRLERLFDYTIMKKLFLFVNYFFVLGKRFNNILSSESKHHTI